MTKSPLFYCCCLTLVLTCVQIIDGQNGRRIRYTVNDNWQFLNSDITGGEKKNIATIGWEPVSLPHTWNSSDAFDDEPGYRRGPGWYRRELRLGDELRNKQIFIYFEGANHTAEVFVNGRLVGRHVGGYTAFVFDVTDLVDFDKANLIAVKVDNVLDKDKPPIDGDFTMYGGIYRDVWLIATDEVHFKTADRTDECVSGVPFRNPGTPGTGGTLPPQCSYASMGVEVETPEVSSNSAEVTVSGTIVNAGNIDRRVEIVTTILDRHNARIALSTTIRRLGANSTIEFEQQPIRVTKPKLWSPDDPYLYRVQTVIRENGRILDEVTNPLGFRWFKFDAAKGFFLNGKPLKLRGTNRHQDYAGIGNAVPDYLHVRDLEIIKENGFNFLRLAHYPQDPAVLEAADRLGLLIWEEIPIVNQIHISPAFNENAKRMLTEMIRQHRKHPSIIIWGYMNEVFIPGRLTDETVEASVALAKELEKICKAEDPGRTTAIAFEYGARERYQSSGLGGITDIIGWNLYYGWYYGVFDDFGKFIDDQHRRFPTRPLIISEYGANGDRRLNSVEPKRYDSSMQWQMMFHESMLKQIDERKFVSGSAIWNQFDFGSEFRGETIPHINQKGMYTYDRQPKDISYFYKARFSVKPVLHLAVSDRKFRSGTARQMIDAYTNFPAAELFHNGRSIGTKAAVDGKVSWPVTLIGGRNRFTLRALPKTRVQYSDTTADVHFSDYDTQFRSGFRDIAVNVGSNAEFVADGGIVWAADKAYAKGNWGFIEGGAKAISTGRNVLGTLEDPLFQTMMSGAVKYRFDVSAGNYEVELRFVEPEFRDQGKRIFDIRFNGAKAAEGVDLARDVGFMRGSTRKFHISVENPSGLLIEVTPTVGRALLSGIRLTKTF